MSNLQCEVFQHFCRSEPKNIISLIKENAIHLQIFRFIGKSKDLESIFLLFSFPSSLSPFLFYYFIIIIIFYLMRQVIDFHINPPPLLVVALPSKGFVFIKPKIAIRMLLILYIFSFLYIPFCYTRILARIYKRREWTNIYTRILANPIDKYHSHCH